MKEILTEKAWLIIVSLIILVSCRDTPASLQEATIASGTDTPAPAVGSGSGPGQPMQTLTQIPPTQPGRIETPPSPPADDPAPVALTGANVSDIVPLRNLASPSGGITALAFSPDNVLLASSSNDGTIQIWQVSDGRPLHTLAQHTGSVRSLSFAPDTNLLASGSDDQTVILWQADRGELTQVLDSSLAGKALKVTFSPDGTLLAIGGDLCRVLLRHASTGLLRRTLHQPECHPNEGNRVEFWGLAFSPDNSVLFTSDGQSGTGTGSIQIWTYEQHIPPQLLKGYNVVTRDLSIAPDGGSLAVALSRMSEVWLLDASDGNRIHKLEGHQFRVNSVAFSPDGGLVASGGRDQTVRLWSPLEGELLKILEGHSDAVNNVAFSPDGSMIASGSEDGVVIIWGVKGP